MDNRWLRGLFGDQQVATAFSDSQQLRAILDVEAAYTSAVVAAGSVSPQIAQPVLDLLVDPTLDHAALEAAVEIDGIIVPSLIKQLKAQLPNECHEALHVGLTSQDIIDTAFALITRPVLIEFTQRLHQLDQRLSDLSNLYGEKPMMSRTRMQAALPIKVTDRIDTWRIPLLEHTKRLDILRPTIEVLSIGGPVGTREIDTIATHMAEALSLGLPPKAPHSMRGHIADLAGWLSLVTGSLGKIGQDITLMAQQGIDEIKLRGGGRSSAMSHKSNPIRAETLVTLARYNATQLSGVHHAIVHEQERSGAAWALEWMLLPAMLETTGAALKATHHLLKDIDDIGS